MEHVQNKLLHFLKKCGTCSKNKKQILWVLNKPTNWLIFECKLVRTQAD